MSIKQHGRQYDLVVLGATGYTGVLTAEHIATHLPTDLKWALAGRSEAKIQSVIDLCKKENADRIQPAIEIANINEEEQLKALASKSCVLITTVGPYSVYGEKVFKACAETGTHYFDCTGEFPWVRRMINKYEKAAKASGAIMIPQIGLESAPPDLCTWALAKVLREQLHVQTADTVITIHKLKSAPSGGTLASVLGIFESFSIKEVSEAGKPYVVSPLEHKDPARPSPTLFQRIFGTRRLPDLGILTTSVTTITDATVVERTWGLLSTTPTREQEFYGENFTWTSYFRVRGWLQGVAMHWALGFFSILLALVPPFRSLARKLIYQPGDGPKRENTLDEEVEYRGIAKPDTLGSTTARAHVRARYAGSIYYLTGLFLAQGALTVLQDDTGLPGGIYTPACLGQPFIDRVNDAGFQLEAKLLKE